MKKTLIKIAYRQIIGNQCKTEFERNVFNDSYSEFCMQVQSFAESKEFTSWSDIRKNAKANTNVQYKTGFAIGLYIRNLNNLVPGLLDSLGQQTIPFESHRFEIIESDTQKKEQHCVAITYVSNTFTFFGAIGDYMLVAAGDYSKKSNEAVATFLLKVQPNLAVISHQQLEEEKVFDEFIG